jgi:hypothetical protein
MTKGEIPSQWKDATRAPPIPRASRNPSGTVKLTLIYSDPGGDVTIAAYPKLGVWGSLGEFRGPVCFLLHWTEVSWRRWWVGTWKKFLVQ